jgi:hypothetical protein
MVVSLVGVDSFLGTTGAGLAGVVGVLEVLF